MDIDALPRRDPDRDADRPLALALGAYFANAHFTALAAVLSTAIIAASFWSPALAPQLLTWVGAISLIAVLRASTAVAYTRGLFPHWSLQRWERIGYGVPILMGSVWGWGAGWLYGVGHEAQLLVLICVAIGAVLGSITNVVYWPAHVGFFVPLMSLMVVGMLRSPRPESPFLVLGAVLISGLTALQGRALGRRLVSALQLSDENRRLVERLHEHTTALEVANERLARLSTTDPLTGLSNRRGWDLALERERQRAIRQRHGLGLLVVDIDHFKTYNDSHGHGAGDICLSAVARVLGEAVRNAGDIVARLGGEEFGVLLTDVDNARLRAVAERMRLQVEALYPASGAELHRRVTVSIGAATTADPDAQPSERLIAQADLALYEAKRRGRNQVCLHEEQV